jgi:hypothetical protein
MKNSFFAAVVLLILVASGHANAALVTFDFTGTITDHSEAYGNWAPVAGTALPAISIGDSLNVSVTVDNSKTNWDPVSLSISINTAGGQITRSISSFTGWDVRPRQPLYTSEGSLRYFEYYMYDKPSNADNGFSLYFEPSAPDSGFRLLIDMNDSTKTVQVQSTDMTPTPSPAAFWLTGSGLLCLFGIRGRRKHA